MPAHLPIALIADGHVVGGDGLRHRARRCPYPEKPCGNFLASANLSYCAVDIPREVERESFLMCIERVLRHIQ